MNMIDRIISIPNIIGTFEIPKITWIRRYNPRHATTCFDGNCTDSGGDFYSMSASTVEGIHRHLPF